MAHGPRLRLDPQRDQLGRQRPPARAQPRIHTRRVGLELTARLRRQHRLLRARGAPQADRAEESVRVGQAGAHHLRQPPLRHPPEQLHLPQPVLRVHVALREEQVRRRFRPHVRHAQRVPPHVHGCLQSRQRRAAIDLRPRAAQVPHAQRTADQDPDRERDRQVDQDPFHGLSPVHAGSTGAPTGAAPGADLAVSASSTAFSTEISTGPIMMPISPNVYTPVTSARNIQ